MMSKIVEVKSFDELLELMAKEMTRSNNEENSDMHQHILDEIHCTYLKKNERYGNSFSAQFEKHGLLSSVIRLEDKFRRFEQLATHQDMDGLDESIEDTLLDMANYAILTVMELRKNRGEE